MLLKTGSAGASISGREALLVSERLPSLLDCLFFLVISYEQFWGTICSVFMVRILSRDMIGLFFVFSFLSKMWCICLKKVYVLSDGEFENFRSKFTLGVICLSLIHI